MWFKTLLILGLIFNCYPCTISAHLTIQPAVLCHGGKNQHRLHYLNGIFRLASWFFRHCKIYLRYQYISLLKWLVRSLYLSMLTPRTRLTKQLVCPWLCNTSQRPWLNSFISDWGCVLSALQYTAAKADHASWHNQVLLFSKGPGETKLLNVAGRGSLYSYFMLYLLFFSYNWFNTLVWGLKMRYAPHILFFLLLYFSAAVNNPSLNIITWECAYTPH